MTAGTKTNKSLSLLVWAVRAIFFVGAMVGSLVSPTVAFTFSLPPAALTVFLLLPVLFCGVINCWIQPVSFLFHPIPVEWFDKKFGPGSYECYLLRLRPFLLFAAVCVVQGSALFWKAARNGAGHESYLFSGFCLSTGLGFVLGHFILYRRKAFGVFPSAVIEKSHLPPTTVVKREMLPLRQAVRTYWWALSGVALCPGIFLYGSGNERIPFEYFVPLFFGSTLLAQWPCISGRAPRSFWRVAMGVFAGGFFAAVILGQFLRVIWS